MNLNKFKGVDAYYKEISAQTQLTKDFGFPDIMAYKGGRYNKMELTPIELDMKEIDLPKVDLRKYIGKTAKIEKVSTYEGQHGAFILVETEILETLEGGVKPIEIRASMALGLHQDNKEQWGWSKDTKLGKTLLDYGVSHPDELKGCEVICQVGKRKDGKDRLEFTKK